MKHVISLKRLMLRDILFHITIPFQPFKKIRLDLMEFKNVLCLIILDYFLKWIERGKITTKRVTEIKQNLG